MTKRNTNDTIRQHIAIRNYWAEAIGLYIHPITLATANEFVDKHHRHSDSTQGHKFSIGLSDHRGLRGVVIAGNPIGSRDDDGLTIEIRRLCTLGDKNACSMLYAAAWRAAKAMGYVRGITFTLADEIGTSLHASGWRFVGMTDGRNWDRPNRSRRDAHVIGPKKRWEIGQSKLAA